MPEPEPEPETAQEQEPAPASSGPQEPEADATMYHEESPQDQDNMSEYDKLRAQVAKNPQDGATWNRLIEYAEQLADIDKIKEAYEALLEAYPNAVSHEFLSAVIVY